VVDRPPSGPVDLLSAILGSQTELQEDRRQAARPAAVETREGRMEVPAKGFPSLQYRGQQYSQGDFVYVRPESGGESRIHRIERLFEQEGLRTVLARRFYRARLETFHDLSRTFYETEVARSTLSEIFPISCVLGRCYVLPVHHYNSHLAEGIAEKDTFVCEFTYSPTLRHWKPIEALAYWRPPAGVRLVPREAPLGARQMEEVQQAKRRARPSP
jgi:hypothetical protein